MARIAADLNNHGNPQGPIRLSAVIGGSSVGRADFHNSTVRLRDSSSFSATQVFGSLDFVKGFAFIHTQFEMRLCCHFTLLFSSESGAHCPWITVKFLGFVSPVKTFAFYGKRALSLSTYCMRTFAEEHGFAYWLRRCGPLSML